jgi:hypothetical protein
MVMAAIPEGWRSGTGFDKIHGAADAPVHVQVFELGKPADKRDTYTTAIVFYNPHVFLVIEVVDNIGEWLADDVSIYNPVF